MRQITVYFLLNIEEYGRISDCQHEVDEIYALLGYIATRSFKSLTTFQEKPISPIFKGQDFLEEGTDTFSRNVGDGLKLYAA